MKRTEKKMTTCATNEIESNLRRKDWMELLRKFNNEKNKLVVDLWITSQKLWGDNQPQTEMIWVAEKNEEMQNSTSKEYGDLIALRDEKKRYLNSTNKILMNTWRVDQIIKNHREELRWQKDDEIEWRKKE